MEIGDPFASIAEFCQISLSQQDQLSRCRFAGEPEDESLSGDESGGTTVESTGIVMLSIPDSEGNENDGSTSRDNDVFHTPPEESYLAVSEEQQPKNEAAGDRNDPAVEGVAENGNSVGVDCDFMDDTRAVDLGTDADLGFSAEMELTETIQLDSGSQSSFGTNQINDNKVIHFEPDNFRIKEGRLGESDVLGETPVKKFKISDETLGLNTPKPWLGAEVARVLERVAKSIEKLASPSKNSKILDEDVIPQRSQDSSRTKILNSAHTAKKLSFEGPNPESFFNLLQNQPNKNANCSDSEFQGDRCVVRKLQFHSARLEPRMEENEADLADNEDIVEGYETEEIEEESDMEGNKEVSAANEDRTEAETGTEEIEDNKTERLCSTDETSPGVNSLERQTGRVTKSIEDLDKFRYEKPTGPKSSGKDTDFRVKNSLPTSMAENNGKARREVEVVSTSNNKEMTVFDVLGELATYYTFDPALAKLSVFEAAKRGGMTFP